jgi:hypothetical protein
MSTRHANELLYDSEAALRLVDSAIEDIRDAGPRRGGEAPDSAKPNALRELLEASAACGSPRLAEIVARSYGEIVSVLGSLRESRAALQRGTVSPDRLNDAATALTDLEGRLADVAALLDAARLTSEPRTARSEP